MSLAAELWLWALTAVLAVTMGVLTWVLADIATLGFRRYRRVFNERTRFSLRELFLFVEPEKLFLLNLGAMFLCAVLMLLVSSSWVLAAVTALACAWLPRWPLRRLRRRRLDALEQQLPDALLMWAGSLRSGVGLSQALAQYATEAAPPLSQEVDLLLRQQRLGVPLDEALENLGQRVPLQSVALVVSAMRVASETGGALTEALERASATLRQKLLMEGKIRSLTAQGRLQAWVVGALPLVLLVALQRLEPDSMGLLLGTRMGWATLLVVGLLELGGVWLIRRIVSIDV